MQPLSFAGEYLRFTQDPIVTLQLQDIRISRRRMLALLDGAGPFVPVQRIIFCGNSIGLDPGCLDAVVEFVLRIPSLVRYVCLAQRSLNDPIYFRSQPGRAVPLLPPH